MFKAITDAPHTFLRTELGVALRSKQDSNLIGAIDSPQTFIAERQRKIDALFTNENSAIPKLFNDKLAQYQALGLPSEISKNLAMKSAQRLYEEELELLEITMPGGYQKAFQVSSLDHNATIAKNDVVNSNAETVAQYKIRKRAKKAKRRAERG